MTNGEKMVWAAAYAKEFTFDYPSHVHREREAWKLGGEKGLDPWEAYEMAMAHRAAEYACGVVQRLRSSVAGLVDGWGDNSDICLMAREMLGA